jgi:hypothetical protein
VDDTMTGVRAFLPGPTGIRQGSKNGVDNAYVLLTAADGVGCSFLLLVAEFAGLQDHSSESFVVQTVSSPPPKANGALLPPLPAILAYAGSLCNRAAAPSCSAASSTG